jgi:RHS repeat-associated protein
MGRTVSTQYDPNGDELANTYTSGGSSIASSATYAGAPYGLPATETGPDGQTEKFGYDPGGDLTSVTDPLGNTGTAVYNSQGEQTSITSPLGNKTTNTYTGGLLTSSTDALGRTTQYVYDQDDRLVEVINPDGTSTSTTYNGDNQVTSTTDADGNTTTYAYDPNGNLTKVTDPKGNVTSYGYNNADQLTSATDPMGSTTSFTYNAAGEMTSSTDPDGHKTVYQYDSLGRLTFTGYGANSSGGYQSTLTYTYDPANGNLDSVRDSTTGAGTITYTYDAFDHVKTETGPGGTISYAYNAAGELTSMALPGQSAITYTYNADGQLATQTQGVKKATYGYDADGRLQTETMPDGITADYTYDADGDVTGIDYTEGTSAVGNVTYTYNTEGLRTSEGGTLVTTKLPAAESGNTYNADNELTSFGGETYSYDADGNLLLDGTNTYTWNDRGQLASVAGPSGTSTLGYDPLGRMISTTVAGVTTTFAYQGSQLISEKSSDGTDTAFLNGPYGTLASTDDSSGGGGAVQAYLPDALGSTLALVNSAGQVQTSYSYDLFGNTTSSAGATDPNPLRYTGLISGPVMPAGLQDNNARDYSPTTGQFISADPTGMAGSGDNLYAYAGGDPADNSDPSGLQWQLLAAAGCILGGAANDIGGALDGRKHSLGDFFIGGALGCLNGALLGLDGAEEALAGLEGTDIGADGAEDLSGLGDDLGGEGDSGENSCTTQPNSFPANTRVTLASGKTEPISRIKPGDYVKATNPKTGKTTAEPVLAVIQGHKIEHYAAITLTIGTHRKTGVIIATTGHPFYDLTRRAWVQAGSLNPGDHLDTLHATTAIVTRIQRYDQPYATAYNLTIATDHDYYITAAGTGFLVHNCGWGDESGILRAAAAGKGSFGLGEASEQLANEAGEAWVGPGYRVASDGKTLVSEDGLRQYRPPSWKPTIGKWQANFEWRNIASGQWFGNGHLDITGMP